MRTIKNLLWAMPLICMALVVGCTENTTNTDQPNKPTVKKDCKITLDKSQIDASLAGGEYLMPYTIETLDGGENPHAGEKISAEAAESWVKDFSYNVTGALGFTVEPNTSTEARQCLVTVKYRYAEDAIFVVKQGAKINKGFTLENVTPTYFDYTVDVIPEDKKTPYIVMSAHPEYIIQSEFTCGEDFYEDDITYFGWLGQFYGQSFLDIMRTRCKTGDQRNIYVSDAAAGVPYTFYCYYFDYDSGALLSDVTMFTVTTAKPELEELDFTIDYNVDSCMISADVVPVGFEGDYYFDVLNGALVESYLNDLVDLSGNPYYTTVEEVVEYWWSNAVLSMSADMSYSDIIAAYTCVGNNPDGSPKSHYDFELLANHDYYLFAFKMEEHGLCASTPKVVKITTGDVEMSDNVITPTVSNVSHKTATISFTTTNDDYYVAGWATAAEWASYGNNDEERQNYLLSQLNYELISGDYTQNISRLESETDYVLYAFGSRGGIATTDCIYTCPFTTTAEGMGKVSVKLKDLGYYEAADLAQLPGWEFFGNETYAGTVIKPIEFEFTNPEEFESFQWTAYLWTSSNADIRDQYDYDNVMNGLIYMYEAYGPANTGKTYSYLQPGVEVEYVAVAKDKDGQFGPLYRYCMTPSYDGCKSDIQEFDDWWNGNNDGPSLQSLVISEEKALFSKKTEQGTKVSQRSFEKSERVAEADEMFASR